MPRLPLSDVPAHSVLAEPILDSQGRTLLGAGAELSPGLLKRLARWNVLEVTVTGDPAGPGETTDGACQEFRSASLDELFAPHADRPEMGTIRQALELWRERCTHQTHAESGS